MTAVGNLAASSVARLLDEPRKQCPERTAIADGSSSLTFAELSSATLRFAHKLTSLGVGRGARVVIFTDKSVTTVVAILGTLRAGAAYVPLDRNAPPARLEHLVRDVEPAVIVAARPLLDVASWLPHGVPHISFEDVPLGLAADVPALPLEIEADDLACIVFTSGSTGFPKGVMMTYGNIAAFFSAHRRITEIDATSVALNMAPFYFGVSIMDALLPLSAGATVHLTQLLPIPSALLRTLASRRITHLCAVSSVLARITGDGAALKELDLSALRVILFGAEVCDPRVLHAWLRAIPHIRLINNYGQTETTVVCATHLFRAGSPEQQFPSPCTGELNQEFCPIGTPLQHMTALLVDGERVIDASDTPGELLVAGPQITPGYWRRPEEQAQAFVIRDGVPYYRTGDTCMQNDRGDLLYLGRKDDEVKIGGRRVHLNEVRRALLSHPDVKNVAAFAVTSPDGARYVASALIIQCPPSHAAILAVQAHVRDSLPEYMVPRFILVTSDFPQLPTGKVNTRGMSTLLERAMTATRNEFFVVRDGAATPLLASK